MPPPPDVFNPIAAPGDYLTNPVHQLTYPYIDPTKADLNGKCVFISGASKGIGRAVSIAFARAGASYLALGARSDMTELEWAVKAAAKEAHRVEPRVLQIKLDVASQSSIEAAAAAVEKSFGRVDIIINNAGVLGTKNNVADGDPSDWWNTWAINVRGPYLILHAFLPLLLKSEGDLKKILNVTSVGAFVTSPGMSAYQSSKAALLRMTEFVAKEYKDQGITAIGLHPGNIITDIVGGEEGLSEELRPIFVDTPELAADTMVWLTTERRDWLSGRYVSCTWDMEQLSAMEQDIVKGDKLKMILAL
ncbi:MAG: hypothetical protein Q9167_005459 [Letrouitia subvulpina]